MADPRANIVRPCPPAYLGKSAAEIGQSAATRNSFFNAAGKIGDLEVLNSVGAGKIGEGLRTLSSVSNTIRHGCGSLPTSIGGVIGGALDTANSAFTAGSDWVLQQMGMSITTVDAVRAFHPQIANQAWGQAQDVYDKVRRGNFKTSDIPSVLQDMQNLERLGRNIFTPPSGDRQSKLMPQCEASPYAVDLIARAPKHKFMFIVQFVPNDAYKSLGALDWAFTAQHSTRPNVKYQTEEINFYNFRSKLITKAEFEPMSMKFYDDIRNQSGQFYAAYMKAMSPLANYSKSNEGFDFEKQGMEFTAANGVPITGVDFVNKQFSSSTGALLQGHKTIFSEIVLYHVFDAGRKVDVFRFYNPRITELSLDELAMDESSPTMLDINFVYDAVYVDSSVPFESVAAAGARAGAAGVGGSAVYPMRYIGAPGGLNAPNNAGLAPLGEPAQPSGGDCDAPKNTSNPGNRTPPFVAQ